MRWLSAELAQCLTTEVVTSPNQVKEEPLMWLACYQGESQHEKAREKIALQKVNL